MSHIACCKLSCLNLPNHVCDHLAKPKYMQQSVHARHVFCWASSALFKLFWPSFSDDARKAVRLAGSTRNMKRLADEGCPPLQRHCSASSADCLPFPRASSRRRLHRNRRVSKPEQPNVLWCRSKLRQWEIGNESVAIRDCTHASALTPEPPKPAFAGTSETIHSPRPRRHLDDSQKGTSGGRHKCDNYNTL